MKSVKGFTRVKCKWRSSGEGARRALAGLGLALGRWGMGGLTDYALNGLGVGRWINCYDLHGMLAWAIGVAKCEFVPGTVCRLSRDRLLIYCRF